MKTEPTLILELVRAAALVAGFFGVAITIEEQAVIAGAIGSLVLLVSVAIAIKNRLSVFSPRTTQTLVDQAGAGGSFDVGSPPAG